MGFSRQEYWSESPCLPPGDPPDPGIKLKSLVSPTLAGRFFYCWAAREGPSPPLKAAKLKRANLGLIPGRAEFSMLTWLLHCRKTSNRQPEITKNEKSFCLSRHPDSVIISPLPSASLHTYLPKGHRQGLCQWLWRNSAQLQLLTHRLTQTAIPPILSLVPHSPQPCWLGQPCRGDKLILKDGCSALAAGPFSHNYPTWDSAHDIIRNGFGRKDQTVGKASRGRIHLLKTPTENVIKCFCLLNLSSLKLVQGQFSCLVLREETEWERQSQGAGWCKRLESRLKKSPKLTESHTQKVIWN